jgi:hypothetical protein
MSTTCSWVRAGKMSPHSLTSQQAGSSLQALRALCWKLAERGEHLERHDRVCWNSCDYTAQQARSYLNPRLSRASFAVAAMEVAVQTTSGLSSIAAEVEQLWKHWQKQAVTDEESAVTARPTLSVAGSAQAQRLLLLHRIHIPLSPGPWRLHGAESTAGTTCGHIACMYLVPWHGGLPRELPPPRYAAVLHHASQAVTAHAGRNNKDINRAQIDRLSPRPTHACYKPAKAVAHSPVLSLGAALCFAALQRPARHVHAQRMHHMCLAASGSQLA